jgi:hypothetical protein
VVVARRRSFTAAFSSLFERDRGPYHALFEVSRRHGSPMPASLIDNARCFVPLHPALRLASPSARSSSLTNGLGSTERSSALRRAPS